MCLLGNLQKYIKVIISIKAAKNDLIILLFIYALNYFTSIVKQYQKLIQIDSSHTTTILRTCKMSA